MFVGLNCWPDKTRHLKTLINNENNHITDNNQAPAADWSFYQAGRPSSTWLNYSARLTHIQTHKLGQNPMNWPVLTRAVPDESWESAERRFLLDLMWRTSADLKLQQLNIRYVCRSDWRARLLLLLKPNLWLTLQMWPFLSRSLWSCTIQQSFIKM